MTARRSIPTRSGSPATRRGSCETWPTGSRGCSDPRVDRRSLFSRVRVSRVRLFGRVHGLRFMEKRSAHLRGAAGVRLRPFRRVAPIRDSVVTPATAPVAVLCKNCEITFPRTGHRTAYCSDSCAVQGGSAFAKASNVKRGRTPPQGWRSPYSEVMAQRTAAFLDRPRDSVFTRERLSELKRMNYPDES